MRPRPQIPAVGEISGGQSSALGGVGWISEGLPCLKQSLGARSSHVYQVAQGESRYCTDHAILRILPRGPCVYPTWCSSEPLLWYANMQELLEVSKGVSEAGEND
jgi:hypothetical protein